tara:strand:- start:2230 stop:2349 length:120 start_codon:yes stop_codon:yes gene_type:complete
MEAFMPCICLGDEPKMKELDGGSDGVAGSSAETAGQTLP